MKNRVKSILEKINDIEYFLSKKDGRIVLALEDRILKPAIRMQIIAIAEINLKMKVHLNFCPSLI